jgi:hypothetical protein
VIGCLFCDGPKPCGQWTWFMFGCGRRGNVVRGEVRRTQPKPFQVKTLEVLVNSRTKWSVMCSLVAYRRVLVFWYCGTASHCCRQCTRIRVNVSGKGMTISGHCGVSQAVAGPCWLQLCAVLGSWDVDILDLSVQMELVSWSRLMCAATGCPGWGFCSIL